MAIPLFVPTPGLPLLKYLASAEFSTFVAEVDRFRALGAPWASAIMGYMKLLPQSNGARDISAAILFCSGPAALGDHYSQYILAWAYRFGGRDQEALQAMKAAALGGFAPAMMDLASFMAAGYGVRFPDASAAIGILGNAKRLKHKGAFGRRCEIYSLGTLGVARKVIGVALSPFVRIVYGLAVIRNPFSERVFLFDARKTARLFRQRRN